MNIATNLSRDILKFFNFDHQQAENRVRKEALWYDFGTNISSKLYFNNISKMLFFNISWSKFILQWISALTRKNHTFGWKSHFAPNGLAKNRNEGECFPPLCNFKFSRIDVTFLRGAPKQASSHCMCITLQVRKHFQSTSHPPSRKNTSNLRVITLRAGRTFPIYESWLF